MLVELVFALRHACRAYRVGHQRDAPRHRCGGHPEDGRVDVDAVRDQLRSGVRRYQRGPRRARLAMVHAGHGIEQVREMRCSPFQRHAGLGVIRRGVADGKQHAVAKVLDQPARPLQLRREGDDPAQVRRLVEQRVDLVDVGRADGGDILRAGPLDVDVRPLKVNAAHLRRAVRAAPGNAGDGGHGVANGLARAGERGGGHGRGAMLHVERRHACRRLVRGVHEIRAVPAVHVHVDESGHDDAAHVDDLAGGRNPLADRSDLFAVHDHAGAGADCAAHEGAPAKRDGHAQMVPRMVGRPPVAPGTFVSKPAIESLAISAMAIASFSCRYL